MYNTKLTVKILISFLIIIPAFVSAQLSPNDAISLMKKGINLGNTLEPPQEGEWGNPATQEYFFDMYKKEGFDFIRIPVRWDKHMSTTSPFKIDDSWLKRVEQILDWGLAKGLYMVVNSHHDDWIKSGYANPVNQARFDSLWSQVAIRFKNKSEKLIFEIANEPVNMTKAQNDQMHQKAINVIRKTNPTRLIIFQGIDWGGSDALINAAIPNDPYIIGSFHSYDPYPFGLLGTGTFGTAADINILKAKFQKVKDWSVKNNIPVFLGEFGSTVKCDYNSRMKQYKTYVELANTFGFALCAWDDGGDFKIMKRQTKTWFDDIKDILTQSSVLSPKTPRLQILQDTIVKLDWTNPASDYDTLFIERRTANTTFKRIAVLKGDAVMFSDLKLPQNIEYFYRVIAYSASIGSLYSYPQKILLPTYVPKDPLVRKLFTGNAMPIPGRIEAENFDGGGEGFTYHDSDLKNIIGDYRPDEAVDIYDKSNGIYIVTENYPGEWLEYTVNINEKGLYDITATTAAFESGGTFKIKIGQAESEIITVPTTNSWVNTKSVSFSMNLEAGIQIMRLSFLEKPLFNIDYLEFIKNISTTAKKNLGNDQIFIRQTKQELIIVSMINHPVEKLTIFSVSGAEIKTLISPGANFRVSTQSLHSGIYIVQAISGNQKFSQKFVIQ